VPLVHRPNNNNIMIIIAVINISIFVWHHDVMTSEALEPCSVLVISKSIPIKESLRRDESLAQI